MGKKERRVSKVDTKKQTKGVQKRVKDNDRPIYPIGTILVTYTSDGRHRFYNFYEVVSLTKTQSPRVKCISVNIVSTYNNPSCGESILTPSLGQYTSGVQPMRWRKNAGSYLTKDDGSEGHMSHTEIYNPSTTYKNTWISD